MSDVKMNNWRGVNPQTNASLWNTLFLRVHHTASYSSQPLAKQANHANGEAQRTIFYMVRKEPNSFDLLLLLSSTLHIVSTCFVFSPTLPSTLCHPLPPSGDESLPTCCQLVAVVPLLFHCCFESLSEEVPPEDDFYLPGRIDYLYLRAICGIGKLFGNEGRLFKSRKLFNRRREVKFNEPCFFKLMMGERGI